MGGGDNLEQLKKLPGGFVSILGTDPNGAYLRNVIVRFA